MRNLQEICRNCALWKQLYILSDQRKSSNPFSMQVWSHHIQLVSSGTGDQARHCTLQTSPFALCSAQLCCERSSLLTCLRSHRCFPGAWASATQWETRMQLQLLPSPWPSLGCWDHLENEPVHGRYLSLSVVISFSDTLPFNKQIYLKKKLSLPITCVSASHFLLLPHLGRHNRIVFLLFTVIVTICTFYILSIFNFICIRLGGREILVHSSNACDSTFTKTHSIFPWNSHYCRQICHVGLLKRMLFMPSFEFSGAEC